jgi:hypothetical protein
LIDVPDADFWAAMKTHLFDSAAPLSLNALVVALVNVMFVNAVAVRMSKRNQILESDDIPYDDPASKIATQTTAYVAWLQDNMTPEALLTNAETYVPDTAPHLSQFANGVRLGRLRHMLNLCNRFFATMQPPPGT